MSWVQVKSPNLNVQTSMGMCLKYVQDAFGSGWAGSYALQGWRDIVKKKHYDRNIPAGVYVPIWFEGYWNGVNYGHVAIYKDGICWSSPYRNKTSHDQLGNIETVERVYGMKYIGWSEDIGGTTVIRKGDSMAIIQNTDNWYNRCNDTHIRMTGDALARKTFNNYVGLDFLRLVEDITKTAGAHKALGWLRLGRLADKDKWQQQIYDWRDKATAYLKERNAARDEVAPLRTQVSAQSLEIADLKAQLAVQSDDTKNLNALGQALQWFVSRVGIK